MAVGESCEAVLQPAVSNEQDDEAHPHRHQQQEQHGHHDGSHVAGLRSLGGGGQCAWRQQSRSSAELAFFPTPCQPLLFKHMTCTRHFRLYTQASCLPFRLLTHTVCFLTTTSRIQQQGLSPVLYQTRGQFIAIVQFASHCKNNVS